MFGPGVGRPSLPQRTWIVQYEGVDVLHSMFVDQPGFDSGGLQQEGVNPSSVDLRDASRNVPSLNRFDLIATVSIG